MSSNPPTPTIKKYTQVWPSTDDAGVSGGAEKGRLQWLAGHHPSSRFSERACDKEIRKRTIEQDTQHCPLASAGMQRTHTSVCTLMGTYTCIHGIHKKTSTLLTYGFSIRRVVYAAQPSRNPWLLRIREAGVFGAAVTELG